MRVAEGNAGIRYSWGKSAEIKLPMPSDTGKW